MAAFKAILIGESGVGKSTLSKLLRNLPTNGARKPTVGVNIEKVSTGAGNMCLWDLAGQRRFRVMWTDFMRGSQLAIVVTDSSPENVAHTKEIINRYMTNTAAKVIAIANKQDLNESLSPEEVQAKLGVPTYGMVGIQHQNKTRLIQIIERSV
ncbi:MAG: ADP-ribosylation factor-like protein [Promethearchaeota archaeon]